MEKEADSVKSEAIRLVWYMRGGVSFNEVMHMSYKERMVIGDLIKENMETTKKSGMPFF